MVWEVVGWLERREGEVVKRGLKKGEGMVKILERVGGVVRGGEEGVEVGVVAGEYWVKGW